MLDTTPLLMLAITIHRTGLDIERCLTHAVTHLIERRDDDRGQATTEYALVLLAAALVALLVVAWATAGGGAAKISRLFNRVIDSVTDKV
ncbi:DUF4244 domain-containing protein [Ilumatobacter nonamiensis]|uniref:DUF4244 domain-containing protein n=1 Tax=Ilumatobacter nonamiensis TaxID=467093 RepID=UPI00034818DD|nr:DUF4244 domain-containing protein [Ilumatobacter nonamiensis]